MHAAMINSKTMRSIQAPVVISLVSILIHGVLLITCSRQEQADFLPREWQLVACAVLLLVAAISTAICWIGSKKPAACLYVLNILLSFLLLVPGRSSLPDFQLFIGLIVFQGAYHFNNLVGAGVSVLYFLFLWSVRQCNLYAWSCAVPPMDIGPLLSVSVLAAVCASIGSCLGGEKRHTQLMKKRLDQLDQANEMLVSSNINLQMMVLGEKNRAVQNERRRIAREFHDTAACMFINSLSLLETYRLRAQNHQAPSIEPIVESCELIRQGFWDIRKTISFLRMNTVQPIVGIHGIKGLVEIFQRSTGINVLLDYGDIPATLDYQIEETLFRAVQEGLSNAIRHGRAKEVRVHFQTCHQGLQLSIKDNGAGTSHAIDGFGLSGMRERVDALGGTFRTYSSPNCGFVLLIWVPLKNQLKGGRNDASHRYR